MHVENVASYSITPVVYGNMSDRSTKLILNDIHVEDVASRSHNLAVYGIMNEYNTNQTPNDIHVRNVASYSKPPRGYRAINERSTNSDDIHVEDVATHLHIIAVYHRHEQTQHNPNRKRYSCEYSSKSFAGRQATQQHERVVHLGEAFSCQLSHKIFSWPSGW
jgi:hypothetical protein